ncbi:MAG: ABC transporter permease [Thermomicrobiales bacterium]|nr:ABC transporter permease [Thermomicrobiales bacterium]
MTRQPRLAAHFAPLLTSLAAVVAAMLLGGIFLAIRGKDPVAAFAMLFSRGLGTSYGISESLIRMAPLLIVSAGLVIALRAGVWNIGIDGQLLIGALFAGVTGSSLAGQIPPPLMWLAAALAGIIGGLLWALVPGLLRVRWGLNEIITTLMMNYVAINVTSWLVKGPVKDPSVVPPQTRLIPVELRLPKIPGTGVHIGLLVGLLAVILVTILFRHTVAGFMLDVLGRNRQAAIHAGMPVNRLTLLALLASGALAGLAGANDILGVKGLFQGNWNPGYGFAAFALVYLARLDSLWIIPFAWFLSFLSIGGEMMARPLNIPTYFVDMLEGLMLLCFAVATWFERLRSPYGRAEVEIGPANAGEPPGPAVRETAVGSAAGNIGGRR